MLTRRQLLQRGAAGGAALWCIRVPWASPAAAATPALSKFTEPLPIPPVLDGANGNRLTIAARESLWKFHANLPATRTWGYWAGDTGIGYLGPTIEATSRSDDQTGPGLAITWLNELDEAFLPNDPTLMGAVMRGEPPRIVTHVHGGENHAQYDGTPLQWYTKNSADTGPHYVTNTFHYFNEQRASMVWYHDHALGNTRTNVYAGLAGLYFIRDARDTGKAGNPLGLPAGPYEIPLVLQDKTFNADGSLFYPSVGALPSVHPQWVPEFFGDVAVINAKIFPFAAVEPRRYRLRIVNGSQSRFYRLQFVTETGGRAMTFHQIGTEGGLLRAPVAMTALLISPGERADVVIDFAGLPRNTSIIVTNNAVAPYPNGPHSVRKGGAPLPQLMRFLVDQPLSSRDNTTPAASLSLPELPLLPDPPRTGVRRQQLSETLDPLTGVPVNLNVEGKDLAYLGADGLPGVTTRPANKAVEDWLLVNTTMDTHPIHLHLVTFEVKGRRPFNAAAYDPANPPATIPYTGPELPPAPNENGRKDTVQAPPGQVTRIRARFELPDEPAPDPLATDLPQYVWHCHILEHEENDMMRAYEVLP